MNRPLIKSLAALTVAVVLLAMLPVSALAAAPSDIVVGNNYTLDAGNTLNDDLLILGGNVNLLNGSTVNGSVFLIGGNLQAGGAINGNLTVLGATVTLESTFVLKGDFTYAGATVSRDPGAQINGQIHTNGNSPYLILPGGFQLPNVNMNFDPVFRVGSFFLGLFLWTLAAMILAMFIPSYMTRVSQAAMTQPLIAGGLGLLTVIVIPLIIIILAITICLIPVAILGAFLLVVAWAFGIIALGFELGKRIALAFKLDWHPAIIAGLGTLIMMAVINGIDLVIPCLGWMPKALVGFVGLGAVLFTQFGLKNYIPDKTLVGSNPENSQPV